MPVFIAPAVLGDLLKREYDRDYCREEVVLQDRAGGYPLGAVLGKVTASGEYAFSDATGSTGAEAACAVLLEAAPPGKKTGLVAARGPVIVSDAALVFDPSVNSDELKQQKHQQLTAYGIVVRHAV